MSEDEPAEKVKTIRLSADLSARTYRVEELTDSTEFLPGEMLGHERVAEMCADPLWKVKVVRPK